MCRGLTQRCTMYVLLLCLCLIFVALFAFWCWTADVGLTAEQSRLHQKEQLLEHRANQRKDRVTPHRSRHSFHSTSLSSDLHYGVVVDCGSSGSRIFVYAWPTHSGNKRELLDIRPLADQHMRPVVRKISPGLSALALRPAQAPEYLNALLDYAAIHVPAEKQRETPLYILATAGMRLISARAQRAILSELRYHIPLRYNFLFSENHVEIISGKQEGVYGWIAANYLLGRFAQPQNAESAPLVAVAHERSSERVSEPAHVHMRPRTVGVIDMGGASFQVTMEVSRELAASLPEDLVAQFNIGSSREDTSHTYAIYVTTFLGYGANAARQRYEARLASIARVGVQNIKDSSHGATKTLFHTNSSSSARLTLLRNEPPTSNNSLAIVLDNAEDARRKMSPAASLLPPPVWTDHCLPSGLTVRSASTGQRLIGRGDFRLCINDVLALLDLNTTCQLPPCSLNGRHQPTIDFVRQEFYGFSEYWYTTAQVLKVGGHYDYRKFYEAAKNYCGSSWTTIKEKFRARLYPEADSERMRDQCFKSAWITAVLHYGLGFPTLYRHFHSVQSINGAEVQWTLGALLYRTRYYPLREVQKASFEALQRQRSRRAPTIYQYWLLLFTALFVLVLVMSKLHVRCAEQLRFLRDFRLRSF